MKKKIYSWMPKTRFLRMLMQSPIGILGINWVFQGMRGMQQKELGFRVLLELILLITISMFLPEAWGVFIKFLVSLFIAHSLNWFFNTHLWVCVRYFPVYRRDPKVLSSYLAKEEKFLQSLPWLNEAVCIGSVGDSGDISSERSDIDLRLIFPSGIINWFRVNILLLRLRFYALFLIIPLDLYAYDDINALDQFRQDEGMRVILDRQSCLSIRFVNRTQRD